MDSAKIQSQKYSVLLIITTIISTILKLKSYVIIKLLTHFFSKEQYAEYSFMLNTGLFLSMFATGWIVHSLNRYFPEINEKEDKKSIYLMMNSSVAFSILFVLIVTSGFFILDKIFVIINFNNNRIIILLAGLLALLYGIYTLFFRYNLIFKKTKPLLTYFITYEIFGFIGFLVGLLLFKTIFGIFISFLVGSLISFVFIIYDWRTNFFPKRVSHKLFFKFTRFGLPKHLSEISNQLFFYLVSLLILYNFSETAYAELAIANSIVLLIAFVLKNITINFHPHISSLYSINDEESIEQVKKDINKTFKMYIFLSLGGIIVITSLPKFLILLLSTSEYLDAAPMIIFISIFQVVFYLTRIVGIGLFIKEKTIQDLMITIFALIVGILTAIFLGNAFGITGYLCSLLIFVITRFSISWFLSNRYFKIQYDRKFILKIIGICIILSLEYFIAFRYKFDNYLILISLPTFLFYVYIFKVIDYKIFINYLKPIIDSIKSIFERKKPKND